MVRRLGTDVVLDLVLLISTGRFAGLGFGDDDEGRHDLGMLFELSPAVSHDPRLFLHPNEIGTAGDMRRFLPLELVVQSHGLRPIQRRHVANGGKVFALDHRGSRIDQAGRRSCIGSRTRVTDGSGRWCLRALVDYITTGCSRVDGEKSDQTDDEECFVEKWILIAEVEEHGLGYRSEFVGQDKQVDDRSDGWSGRSTVVMPLRLEYGRRLIRGEHQS